MVEYDTSVEVSGVNTKGCTLFGRMSVDTMDGAEIALESVRKILHNSKIVEQERGTVVASIGERVEVSSLTQTLIEAEGDVSEGYSNDIEDENLSNVEAHDLSQELAKDVTSLTTYAIDEDENRADLILEVKFGVDMSQRDFESGWSEYISQEEKTVNEMFDKIEFIRDSGSVLFVSEVGSLPIRPFMKRYYTMDDYFPLMSGTITCRPKEETHGGSFSVSGP